MQPVAPVPAAIKSKSKSHCRYAGDYFLFSKSVQTYSGGPSSPSVRTRDSIPGLRQATTPIWDPRWYSWLRQCATSMKVRLPTASLEFFIDITLPAALWSRVDSASSRNEFVCLFFGASAPQWARSSSFTRFLDHTQRRTTVGRTPLDEWSDRHRDLYLTTHTTLTTDRHPCPRWDSNPLSQQASGRRPTP